ncbi:hypothetical protein FHW36_102102 [Chitinophaga polysaccharea]|uniref:Uncharacterized protein n=1 Tax=Chitinophaga polysaccharea TaxID=1293035 RepID=A0A561PW70_9BACT|nr:hypothetical protein [Chitinophaga polysaccharea]TWF42347.1 hypothetical protein FHW36_102102 [Chitinophaga polysaccharea]
MSPQDYCASFARVPGEHGIETHIRPWMVDNAMGFRGCTPAISPASISQI